MGSKHKSTRMRMQPIAMNSSSSSTTSGGGSGRTGPFRIRRTAAPPPELLLPVNPEPSWSSSSAPSSMPSSPNLSGTQMRLGMSPSTSSSSFDHRPLPPHQHHHADDFLHSTMKLFLLVTPPASRFQVTHLNGRMHTASCSLLYRAQIIFYFLVFSHSSNGPLHHYGKLPGQRSFHFRIGGGFLIMRNTIQSRPDESAFPFFFLKRKREHYSVYRLFFFYRY